MGGRIHGVSSKEAPGATWGAAQWAEWVVATRVGRIRPAGAKGRAQTAADKGGSGVCMAHRVVGESSKAFGFVRGISSRFGSDVTGVGARSVHALTGGALRGHSARV